MSGGDSHLQISIALGRTPESPASYSAERYYAQSTKSKSGNLEVRPKPILILTGIFFPRTKGSPQIPRPGILDRVNSYCVNRAYTKMGSQAVRQSGSQAGRQTDRQTDMIHVKTLTGSFCRIGANQAFCQEHGHDVRGNPANLFSAKRCA